MEELCEDCKDCPFCDTEKCCGVPHSECCPPPFGNPHFHHFPHFHFEHFQHTQPLLFDECWTLPEELALIESKLQFLLEHKHLFHCDFCSWAKEVEKALEELRQKLMDLQAKHEEDIKALQDRCDNLQQQITDLKAVVDKHTEHLKQIDEQIKEIKKDIDEIQNKITDIYSKIDTINQQLSDLDVRITENKRLIDQISIQVNQNVLDIAELKKRVNGHDEKLEEHERRITELERRIEDHETRIKELERLVKEIHDGEDSEGQDISDLQRRVEELERKVEDHEERIKKLEEMLKNLKIDVPVEILDAQQMYNNVGPAWLTWFSGLWSNWDTTGWHYINKIAYDDPDILAGGLIIGRVVANVVWCKLPLVAWHELVIEETDYATIYTKVKTFIEEQGLQQFIYPLYPARGFFDVTLSKAYPTQLDEFKFMGSYIPFINPDPVTTRAYPVWKVSRTGEGPLTWELCQTWNTSVRLQITAESLQAKLCVITDCIYVGFQRNKVYIYSICEVG